MKSTNYDRTSILHKKCIRKNQMRSVCIFTGTRAEYGLLKPLMNAILEDRELQLQIVVSGTHLSPEFGLTYKEIVNDGYHINEKIETILSSDTPNGICKSMGLGLIGYSEAFKRLKPDILVILGDRFEAFAAASAAVIHRIPIGHIHGGECTLGQIDEPFRHSITKMSHLHFTSTEEYRKRVIQLGENPVNVINVGSLGVENIKTLPIQSIGSLKRQIGIDFDKITLLVTFHPVTLEKSTAEKQFRILLKALDEFDNLQIIFTKSNADTDGRIINQLIDNYVAKNPSKAFKFTSMGDLYLSAMNHVAAVVGNSSSGIIEAPSFGIPSINIGDRQEGRIKAGSIINCPADKQHIVSAIRRALSDEFRKYAATIMNPYEGEKTSLTIKDKLKQADLMNIVKKIFFDLTVK